MPDTNVRDTGSGLRLIGVKSGFAWQQLIRLQNAMQRLWLKSEVTNYSSKNNQLFLLHPKGLRRTSTS